MISTGNTVARSNFLDISIHTFLFIAEVHKNKKIVSLAIIVHSCIGLLHGIVVYIYVWKTY